MFVLQPSVKLRITGWIFVAFTSATCDRAREEVSLSPAVNDGLVVNVLDHAVGSSGKLYLQEKVYKRSIIPIYLRDPTT